MKDGMTHNEWTEYCTRKLAHYNHWLLNLKRTPGEPYPGFPEDETPTRRVTAVREETPVKPVENAVKPAIKSKGKPKMEQTKVSKKRPARVAGKGPTKQQIAVEIYKSLNGDKASVIAAIVEETATSVAGATTFFYGAKKIVASQQKPE